MKQSQVYYMVLRASMILSLIHSDNKSYSKDSGEISISTVPTLLRHIL